VFVTINTANRQSLFGEIDARGVRLSPAGETLDQIWNRVPETLSSVALDEYIVMPDHTHALLMMGQTSPSVPLWQVVRWLKSTSVEEYRQGVLHHGWQPYDGKLWHRNFHDRILRSGELEILCRYIKSNPQRRWERMLGEVGATHAIWGTRHDP
jgi:REP element-mobilizing transposase RayT